MPEFGAESFLVMVGAWSLARALRDIAIVVLIAKSLRHCSAKQRREVCGELIAVLRTASLTRR